MNWVEGTNTKSIFKNGIPTEEDLKKYGILNIIDYHFDGTNKDPYDISNGNAQSINSFLLAAWDFLKNIDKTLVNAYYNATIDACNYLLAISKFKKRRYYLSSESAIDRINKNNALKELYNHYLNRGKIYQFKNELNKRFGFENDYKIGVEIIQDKNNVELTKENYRNLNIKIKQDGKIKYFEYYVDSDFYVDGFNETPSTLFILFELLWSIKKSLDNYNNGKYINIYDEYLKLYFYKRLTEKFRTKEIEDEVNSFYKTDNSTSQIIEKLYGQLDGRIGTFRTSNLTETTKDIGYKEINTVNIPFYRSFVKNKKLTIYINKNDLPSCFNFLKSYSSIKDYIIKDRNYLEKIYKEVKELIVNDNKDGLIDGDNIYEIAQKFINDNYNSLVELKLRELICYIKPYFSYNLIYSKNYYNFFKTINKDYQISEDVLFGEEKIGSVIHDYARITIDIDSTENITSLGTGYIKVQQKTPLIKDNQTIHFVSDDITEIKISDRAENYFQTIIYTGDEAKEKVQEFKNSDDYEFTREYKVPEEYETAFNDREIFIVHKCIDKDVPSFKLADVRTDGSKYYLNVTNFYKYNKIENIKQISIMDKTTENEYSFVVDGIQEETKFVDNTVLQLANNYKFDSSYLLNDSLYLYLIQGLNSGEIKVVKENDGNEISIQTITSNYSSVVGSSLIIGKEYSCGILNGVNQYVKVVNDGEDYCLEISVQDSNSSAVVTNSQTFTIEKFLILRKTYNNQEYLNSLPITTIDNTGSEVYILSFNQASGGAKTGFLNDFIKENINKDDDGFTYGWELVNYEFKS